MKNPPTTTVGSLPPPPAGREPGIGRRTFLRITGVLAGLGVAGAGGVALWPGEAGDRLRQRLWDRAASWAEPALPAQPRPSPLTRGDEEALRAVVETLLPPGHTPRRYAELFRFYAENVPGYRGLYTRMRFALDDAVPTPTFAGADPAARRAAIRPVFEVRGSTANRIRSALIARDWRLYERHVVRKVFSVFERTDAYTLLGYPEQPGAPRGLEAYRTAPPPPPDEPATGEPSPP